MDMNTSKTKLFLMELIIIILFFSLAGAVCMNLFTQAKLQSTASTELTNAMLEAQAAAEVARDTNTGVEDTLAGFPQAVRDADGFTVYYDEKWAPASGPEGAAYSMKVAFADEGDMIKARIGVSKQDGNEIYGIDTVRFKGIQGAQPESGVAAQ